MRKPCESNQRPVHFLHGFGEYLSGKLGVPIVPSMFAGDVHLSDEEKHWMSQIMEITGEDTPYWIIVAGGKYDYTIKWWDARRWQAVVDHFRGKIQFVQVGEAGHYHPQLDGVIDLRGRTDLRQLIRLVYHAHGVVCPVTALMHLAAAVPMRPHRARHRACVVVAGGREPMQWEAYPHHQYIHTNGQLLCCDQGGCWKSRTVPRGDGDEKDRAEALCLQPVKVGAHDVRMPDGEPVASAGYLPRCMAMISAGEVIRRIEGYFTGGASRYLTAAENKALRRAEKRGWVPAFGDFARHPSGRAARRPRLVPDPAPPVVEIARVEAQGWEMARRRRAFEKAAARQAVYPVEKFHGRGIVICGGGAKYFPCVYVLVRLLRHLGCVLPIEVWHLGEREMSAPMRALLLAAAEFPRSTINHSPSTLPALRCVDARLLRRLEPIRRLGGWELKSYALLHSRFEEVLLLDADNCPVRDPAFLFETPEYRAHGAIFWPDYGRFAPGRAVWEAAGLEYRDEPEFESGQIVVDKARCWRALLLALHLNEHSEWWYRLVHGDKDTFHLAWRKLGQEYAMPAHPARALDGVMLQSDFEGRLLFQHRNFAKWKLRGNRRVPGFRLERECLGFVEELARAWPEEPAPPARPAGMAPRTPALEPPPAGPLAPREVALV